MSFVNLRSEHIATNIDARDIRRRETHGLDTPKPRTRIVPILITLLTVAVAFPLVWGMWHAYMAAPWTRDGTVRAYVVTIAPEVAGRVVQLPATDNEFVRKGDLLMTIDPTDYAIAVDRAEAAVTQARANAEDAARKAGRRAQLTNLATSDEEKQTFASGAAAAKAAYQQAVADLAHARLDLERTSIRSPVNGYVTNLLVQLGDFANIGQSEISAVDANSYWVDGYFEETSIGSIREGDRAEIRLMGYRQIVQGHVDSVARAINIPNAQPDRAGLASVNPIFTWVRLAQRVPVRIRIDHVPDGVRLVSGMTATVQIDLPSDPSTRWVNWLRVWAGFGRG
jgi:multidrug resistance efflux pump